jgi:carbon storage regulator CsrA
MGLLILERKPGEWIKVGDNIHILLHKVTPSRAWLGFDAPRTIPIVRDDSGESRPSIEAPFTFNDYQIRSLQHAIHFHGGPYCENAHDLHQAIVQQITGGV